MSVSLRLLWAIGTVIVIGLGAIYEFDIVSTKIVYAIGPVLLLSWATVAAILGDRANRERADQ